jgi:hypothetical protein
MYLGVPTTRRTVEPESPDQTEKAPSPCAGSGRARGWGKGRGPLMFIGVPLVFLG